MSLCMLVTLCWWWEGLVLRQGGPLGIEQEIVEELYFLSDGSHLFSVFVQNVFTHKLRSLHNNTCYISNRSGNRHTHTHVCVRIHTVSGLTLNFLPLRGQSHLSLLSS